MNSDTHNPIPKPTLCLVTAPDLFDKPGELAKTVDEAVSGGVNMVQLRGKNLSPDGLAALARELAQVTSDRALFIINGNPELAALCNADGAHLPERAMAAADARRRAGRGMIIGRSVHGISAARSAAAEGVDYLIAGTIFSSPSHPGMSTGGVGMINSIVHEVNPPIIGIGGINAENAAEVMQAGAEGVACISAILASDNPRAAASSIAKAISRCT